jgi:hypothetical protein
MADTEHSIKFPNRKIIDPDSGTQYTPFISDDGRVGYEITNIETGKFEFLYFNPSNGSDDGVPNVFVYQGVNNDPGNDGPLHHYLVLEDEES